MIADRELAGLKVRVHSPDHGAGPFPVMIVDEIQRLEERRHLPATACAG